VETLGHSAADRRCSCARLNSFFETHGRGWAAWVHLLQRLEALAEGFEGLNIKQLQGAAGKVFRIRYGSLRVIVERRGRQCHVFEVVDRKDAY
jgi:hypothetical protein